MNRSRKKSTKKSRAVKGAASKTHKGDKDYTTKKGNKDFHRKSHNVKLRRKPYKKSRSLNAFMQAKEKARKADKASFMYKGQKYTKSMTKTGMAIYKKARKASRKPKRKASRKGMNSFMQAKEKARKADKASFMYKGQKYTKSKTKTGLVVYKKAGAYKFEKKWNPDSYRSMLADDCFLSPKDRKYPICNRQGVPVCQGVMAAYARARLVADTKRVSPKKRAEARRIAEKARRLKKKHGCVHKNSPYM